MQKVQHTYYYILHAQTLNAHILSFKMSTIIFIHTQDFKLSVVIR